VLLDVAHGGIDLRADVLGLGAVAAVENSRLSIPRARDGKFRFVLLTPRHFSAGVYIAAVFAELELSRLRERTKTVLMFESENVFDRTHG
jgi:hypothetical protein